ncbi:MAG: DUF805 domain-containing protein [Ignavibacteriae bacterium]|nr:MAG: DUF805 domain-containing protein [Ignavibacteriota bacterium]
MNTNILSLKGRITRSTFWIMFILASVIRILFYLSTGNDRKLFVLTIIIGLAIDIFITIQAIKRMHDVNESGWFLLIPIYNLVLLCTDGTYGPNDYGDEPKDRGEIKKMEHDGVQLTKKEQSIEDIVKKTQKIKYGYYIKKNKEFGPYEKEEILSYKDDYKINDNSLIKKCIDGEWKKLSEFAELN